MKSMMCHNYWFCVIRAITLPPSPFTNYILKQYAILVGFFFLHIIFSQVSKNESYIKGCAFHHGFSPAIGIFGTDGLIVEDNVIYHTVGEGITLQSPYNRYRGLLVKTWSMAMLPILAKKRDFLNYWRVLVTFLAQSFCSALQFEHQNISKCLPLNCRVIQWKRWLLFNTSLAFASLKPNKAWSTLSQCAHFFIGIRVWGNNITVRRNLVTLTLWPGSYNGRQETTNTNWPAAIEVCCTITQNISKLHS